MKIRLLATLGLLAFSLVAGATSISPCITSTNSNGIALSNWLGSACYVEDTVFSSFSFDNGNGIADAGLIDVSFTDPGSLPAPGVDASIGIHFFISGTTINFNNSGPGFTIRWTESICTAADGCANPNAADSYTIGEAQQNSVVPNSATGSITLTPIGDGSGATLNTDGLSTADFNQQAPINGTGFDVTLQAGLPQAGASSDYYTFNITEAAGPEPGTMMLMGGALVGFSILARKLRKSR